MTAQIYKFPARGRFAAGEQREAPRPASNFSSASAAKVLFGNAWCPEDVARKETTEKK